MTRSAAPLPEFARRLHQLAHQVETLDPAELVGQLEQLKFTVWATLTTSTPAAAPPPAPEPAHLTTKAAAAWLGISPTAVRRYEAAGELAAVRLGRRVLYRRETLERFRAARERARGGAHVT